MKQWHYFKHVHTHHDEQWIDGYYANSVNDAQEIGYENHDYDPDLLLVYIGVENTLDTLINCKRVYSLEN